MSPTQKSSVEEIRARFDGEVERFSNLATGQVATVDAALCLELVAQAAATANPRARQALDVGCGAGNYSLKLRQYLPEVRVNLVDLSQAMLDRARQRLGAAVESAQAADIRTLDFEPGRFDLILASAVLHHLRQPAEWERTFEKFHRWLKPGGGLWVFDLVSHEDPAVQRLMWDRYGRFLEAQGGAAYRDDVFAYIEKEDTPTPLAYQLELLRRAGFDRVDVLHKNSCFAAFGATKAAAGA
jgi:tRNA (cmo5U34)-methyltransferase